MRLELTQAQNGSLKNQTKQMRKVRVTEERERLPLRSSNRVLQWHTYVSRSISFNFVLIIA
jgi:hypothetical protein